MIRYEVLSFRSAVGTDVNFVWCQNCDFGQLHESGASQPVIRCFNCGHLSCFRHSVPWHDRLTCDEYDEMLQDPDGFQSAIDKDDDAAAGAAMVRRLQEEEDEMVARELNEQDKRAEQDRQRQRHEEERQRAQAAQLVEAERMRMEQDKERQRKEQNEERIRMEKDRETQRREQERERQQYEEEYRRARAAQQAEAERDRANQERTRQREELRRRAREDKLSVEKVHATTKPCPGCRWPIEKNDGCAHMTCKPCSLFMLFLLLNHFSWNCIAVLGVKSDQVTDRNRHAMQTSILLELYGELGRPRLYVPLATSSSPTLFSAFPRALNAKLIVSEERH